MTTYTPSFEAALDHAMLYEVGGFWKATAPGVAGGLIDTPANRKAVGYTNDPVDAGGETKFGVAKSGNPDLNIATLDWEGAKRVYFRRYWLAAHCDELASRIAVLHFDGAVNHNPSRAGIFLQRAVGVEADGDIGPATLAAVAAKDAIVVCNLICDQRAKFYNDIVAKKPDQVRFLKGWLRRIDEMRAFTTDPTRTFA